MYVNNFGEYSVKSIKTFMGMEGHGFNAYLYRGKKKVAFVIDDASGGPLDINCWVPDTIPSDINDKEGWKKWHEEVKAEKELLERHCSMLPPATIADRSIPIDSEFFINECFEKAQREKDLNKYRKQCQKMTLFRLKCQSIGEFYTLKNPFNEVIKQHLISKYGDNLGEIFNETFTSGGIPEVLLNY